MPSEIVASPGFEVVIYPAHLGFAARSDDGRGSASSDQHRQAADATFTIGPTFHRQSRAQGLLNRLSDRAATTHDPTYRPHEPICGEANDGDLDKSDQRSQRESRELVIPNFPKA